MDAEAIFIRDGGAYRATGLAVGPWSPDALHGGAPAALLARVLGDAADSGHDGPPLSLARITLDLVRPVPRGPLTIELTPVRPGRRVTVLDAILRDPEGGEVTRARALFLAPAALHATADEPPPFAAPEESRPNDWATEPVTFATGGMEIRLAEGAFLEVGPAVGWFRLSVPLVAGTPASPFDVAVAAGDFGNGIAAALPWEGHTFINPDLTVFLERPPVDEWVAVQARTRVQRGSTALAESVLWDRRGRIGRAVQSLLVGTR
jgi:hypothetical protein